MIILASQSPYKKNLLEKTGYPFKSQSPAVDEEILKKEFKKNFKKDFKGEFKGKFKGDFKGDFKGEFKGKFKGDFKGDAKSLIEFLALKKAESLKDSHKGHIIIGSDQALIFKDEIIGKGHSFEGSKKQLKSFSDQKVELVTALALLFKEKKVEFSNSTLLRFKKLNEDLIDWYLNKDKPFDCAGSFKMESSGAVLFEWIECTDPTAVQGLPLMRLVQELELMSVKRSC